MSYGDRANAILCSGEGANGGAIGSFAVANPGCDNNWSTWWIGSRTQWNVTKDFYMGVDMLYSKLQTADLNSDNHGPWFNRAIWDNRRRQLDVPLPRASRLLSLTICVA